MSIPLPALLGLSHDLRLGRKRRLDWELHADAMSADRRVGVDKGTSLGQLSMDVDVAEMQLLSASLASRGLEPRAPEAELAMLNLLTASFRSAKVGRRENKPTQGSDLEWMVTIDVAPVKSERSQGHFDTLCPAKGTGKDASPDDRLAQLCNITGSSDDGAEDVDGSPADLLNTEVDSPRRGRAQPYPEHSTPEDETWVDRNKQVAIERLQALLRAAATQERGESEREAEEYDPNLEFMEDVTREALLEAEGEELAEMLAPAARCRDVETEFGKIQILSS